MSNNQTPEQGKGSTHVTVACKHPGGLVLQIYKEGFEDVPVLGGGTKRERRFEVDTNYAPVTIRGYENLRADGEGRVPSIGGRYGFALTHGVPAKVWELWCKQHHDHPMLLKGLIFANGSQDQVRGRAKEQGKERNGMEPIDPAKPPQVSKRLKVQTAKMKGGELDESDEAA